MPEIGFPSAISGAVFEIKAADAQELSDGPRLGYRGFELDMQNRVDLGERSSRPRHYFKLGANAESVAIPKAWELERPTRGRNDS